MKSSVIQLMREVRFSIDRDWARGAHGRDGFAGAHPISNSWGGWPSAVGIAPYLVLRIIVRGVPDATTGYLVNIQELDKLLREKAIPLAARRLLESGVGLTGESLLRELWTAVENEVPPPASISALSLWTTPYLHYTVKAQEEREGIPDKGACEKGFSHERGDHPMIELTQSFEFSASHRLHVSTMSDEENRRCFGKCNHPSGHGHNYQVEVTVGRKVSDEGGTVMPVPALEATVKREVIDRLDHKHLNVDVAEFESLNPSVENIARTIWGYLKGKLSPAELRRVRVWETAKTYAEYAE